MRLKTLVSATLIMYVFQTSASVNATSEKNIPTSTKFSKVQSYSIEIGYQVGDIANQTVFIQTPKGYFLDAASLPTQGKGAAYMELHNVAWQTQEVGNISQHKLELDWQIFRVMQETRAFSLKPLNLQFRSNIANEKVLTVHVNAARVIVASLLPTAIDADHTKPLEDATPPLRNTHPMLITLCISLFGLLSSSLYFAWRFDWLPAKLMAFFAAPKPFKCAYREVKSLQKTGDTFSQIDDAMRSLRQACDATAGATLSAENVAVLFERNTKLLPKRIEIEHFYSESERHFFAGSKTVFTMKQLMQLSHELMVLESV